MTKLEHFKQWAAINAPHCSQSMGEVNGKCFFRNTDTNILWRAFQHAFTIRPTENSRLDKATFGKGDNPATVVDRLQGIFPTANPPYPVPEIQQEAAREIVRLREEIKGHEMSCNCW